LLGEHNQEILAELGIAGDALKSLEAGGAFAA
jgi:formyl-CoA transferase